MKYALLSNIPGDHSIHTQGSNLKGIRSRFIKLLALAALFVVTTRIFISYLVGMSQLDHLMKERERSVSHRLQQTLVQPLYDFNPVSVEQALKAEFLQKEVAGLYVWLDDYTTLFSGVVRQGNEVKTVKTFTSMTSHYFVRFPIIYVGRNGKKSTIGVADLYLDEKPAWNDHLHVLFRDFISSLISLFILLIIIGFLVNHNLLMPFEYLRNWMIEIADLPEGRYDSAQERERDFSVYPEIEQMYLTFSSLLSSIQTKQDLVQESEERYRTLVENAPEGIVVIDIEQKKIIDSNERFLEIIGYEAKFLYSMEIEELSPRFQPNEKQTPELLTRYIDMASRGTVVVDEWWLKSSDNELIPCDFRLTPMKSGDNVTLIRASVNDISERKNSEKKMKLLRLYLQEIVDRMPSVMIAVNNHGVVRLWNDEAVTITSVARNSILNRRLMIEFPVFEIIKDEIEIVLRNSSFISLKQIRLSLAGEDSYYDIIIFPVENEDGPVAVIRLDNISERIRMEGLMLQSEKMTSLAGLAAGMAHEINNPLGGIINAEQNIRRRFELGNKVNDKLSKELGISMDTISEYTERRGINRSLSMIRDCGLRAAEIVKNMLQFSREVDSSKILTDIALLIEDTIQLGYSDYDLKKKYDFKYVAIEREYEQNLPHIWCCPGEIEQVLLNLLKNGVQAMNEIDDEDYSPLFTIRLYHDSHFVSIEVQDNGVGIAEDIKNRVFEPFFTTKSVGIGTGLGLAVSFVIVTQNHHGIMEVESTLGKGSTFKVRLPINKES